MLHRLTLLILLLPIASNIYAVKIYECEDEQGQKTFEAHCPPGTTLLQEKNFAGQRKQAVVIPIVYIIPDCPACAAVSKFFQSHNISIEQKNIKDNIELQNALKQKTGNLKVPTVIIGETIITDYDEDRLTSALTEAGFPEK